MTTVAGGKNGRRTAGLPARRAAAAVPSVAEQRSSIDTWLGDYLIPSQFQFGGNTYGIGQGGGSWGYNPRQEFSATLPGHTAALQKCPPAFAAQMVRATVLSQARFQFRRRPWYPDGRRTFGNTNLNVLEQPWPGATQCELISRMEWHAGAAGNAYVTNWTPGRLRVLRPDWVALVFGSQREPDFPAHALDGKLLGYVYQNGGIGSGIDSPEIITPDQMAHWSPIPDPMHAGIGMSWITPAIREIQGDVLATEHKLRFFENSATPNLVVKGLAATSKEQFDELVDMIEEAHIGVRNAYKTLYLTAGADATVVGANLQQMAFKETQGAGETRIAMLSRVHPVVLAAAEGLSGSSLNAGNFNAARRIWGDTWIYPTLQDLCQALSPLINVPPNAELWFDTADMPILREDAKDAADITSTQATTITGLVQEGFTPDSAIEAVKGQNMSLLRHSGLVSVQLQPPGAFFPGNAPQQPTPPPALPNGKQPAQQPAASPVPTFSAAPKGAKALPAGRSAVPDEEPSEPDLSEEERTAEQPDD